MNSDSLYTVDSKRLFNISNHICFDASHVYHAENMIIKFHDGVRCSIDLYIYMINVTIIASETGLIMIVVHSVYIARAIYYSSINAQIVILLGVAHCRALSDS